MHPLTRRVTLLAGVSLALGAPLRKPRGQEATFGRLQLSDPRPLPPTLSWMDAGGTAHGIADFAGQGLLLNFWATWCAPCVAEMPALAALARQLAPRRIAVVPVCTDATGRQAVDAFYAAHGITALGIWLDREQRAYAAIVAAGLPTTLVIDRKGREVARVEGAADWSTAATTIEALCDSA